MLTNLIIAVTCFASVAVFSDRKLFLRLLFSPAIIRSRGQWYRLFTHAFIHTDLIHLVMNMYVLYVFGGMAEALFVEKAGYEKGEFYYFILYVCSIFFSCVPSYQKNKENPWYSAAGASGAVSAAIFAAIVLDPCMEFISIPAPVFGLLYLIYCRYAAIHAKASNIAHDMHYWGSLFGAVFTFVALLTF